MHPMGGATHPSRNRAFQKDPRVPPIHLASNLDLEHKLSDLIADEQGPTVYNTDRQP